MAVGLGLLLLAGLAPASSVVAAAPRADDRQQPTIHYQEAMAHAADRTAFRAGDRVDVPFRSRPGDHWKVGGQAARALPAGRISGRVQRLAGPTGDSVPHASIDTPSIPSGSVVATVDAGWVTQGSDEPRQLAAPVDDGGLHREVFGFLPYWELGSARLDWQKLSTIAYFGVGADGKGNLQTRNTDGSATVGWSGWTSAQMTSVINDAHASGARVVLTVQSFAWSTAGQTRQKALLGSATARANLAAQIAGAVRDRGADGVNLDFEPLATGYADEFTALVRKVRQALDSKARGYQVTFDTTGYIGNYPIEAATATGAADAIMIMGYDYRTAGSGVAGSIAPLAGSAYDIRETLSAFLARIPASKVILGVPYYGRAWSTQTNLLNSRTTTGVKYGSSASATYETARAIVLQYGRHYDGVEGVVWTAYRRQTCTATYGCVTGWRQLYYDDATALGKKYDLVNARNIRGVGIWALGYDGTRPELYQVLRDKFITDSVAPVISAANLTTPAFSPDGDGILDTTTASLTVSGLQTWGYGVQRLDGSVAVASVRSGSRLGKTPSLTWNGRDANGDRVRDGRYLITLWAQDASGNRSQRSFTVVVDTTSPTVASTISRGYFSPDRDGHIDTLTLGWTSSQALRGVARVINAAGATIRSWAFDPAATWSLAWNGVDSRGIVVPDGRYTYRVGGRDAAGNPAVVDRSILVDRTIRAHAWSDTSFDPRAGQRSRMTVALRRTATVTARIYLGGSVVRRIWTDKRLLAGTYAWTWNGKTSAGTYVRPGIYKVVVIATSGIGTTRWYRSVRIEQH